MGGFFFDRYNGDDLKKVFPAQDLAQLVKDSVEYYERQAEYARNQAKKTRQEVAKEIINEHEAENQRLKNRLRYAVAILGSDSELESYKRFCAEHEKCMSSSRANWGRAPYVKQVGTGVGTATTVVCQVCGAEQDITDISNW